MATELNRGSVKRSVRFYSALQNLKIFFKHLGAPFSSLIRLTSYTPLPNSQLKCPTKTMSKYDLVMSALSEAEKKRIFCIWMNSQSVNIDWEKVVVDYGSGNIETFRKRNRETFLKVQAISPAGEKAAGSSPPLTPESEVGEADKGNPRKRKAVGKKARVTKAPRKRKAVPKACEVTESEIEGEED